MTKHKRTLTDAILIIIAIALAIGVGYIGRNSIACEEQPWTDADTYMYKSYDSNRSHSLYSCEKGSYSQDKAAKIARQESALLAEQQQAERKACYEAGKFEYYEFDLVKDYDLSCEKIKYINDHFVDKAEERDGGYVKHTTSNRGFFSSSSSAVEIKLKSWVVLQSLPTDLLLKNISYHSDCNGDTRYWKKQTVCEDGKIFPDETNTCRNGNDVFRDSLKSEFYTESDFIMYYVNNCIEE